MVAGIWKPDLGGLAGNIMPGLPATMGDVYDAAYADGLTGHSVLARQFALEQAIDEKNDKIKAATGVALPNPTRAPIDYGKPQEGVDEDAAQNWQAYRTQLGELRDRFPERFDILADFDENEIAKAQTRANDKRLGEVSAMGPGGGATLVASLAGGFVASLRDPPQLIANILAPGAGFGKSLLYHGVKSAAINAGVEAGIQPFVQSWRAEAGVESGLNEAMKDILMAGAAGGAIDVIGRSAFRAAKVYRGGKWVDDPAAASDGAAGPQAGAAAPGAELASPAAPVARAAPADIDAALDDAARRLPDDHPIRQAADGRPEALVREVEKLGQQATPELRALAHRAETEVLFGPQGAMDEVAQIEGLAQAIRNAVAPEVEPPGFAGVRSPDLARLVDGGLVPEDLAALVARSSPLERQADLAQLLLDKSPASPDAARRILAEELSKPVARMGDVPVAPLSDGNVQALTDVRAALLDKVDNGSPDAERAQRLLDTMPTDAAAADDGRLALWRDFVTSIEGSAAREAGGSIEAKYVPLRSLRAAGLADADGFPVPRASPDLMASLRGFDESRLGARGFEEPNGDGAKLQTEALVRDVQSRIDAVRDLNAAAAKPEAGEEKASLKSPTDMSEAELRGELRDTFGFDRVTVEPGGEKALAQAIDDLRAIAQATGVDTRSIGATIRTELTFKPSEPGKSLGSFERRPWRRGGKMIIGDDPGVIIHEWFHAFDRAASQRGIGRWFRSFATERKPAIDRVSNQTVASFAAAPLVGFPVPFSVLVPLADKLLFGGTLSVTRFRKSYPWMSQGVAEGFRNLASALSHGEKIRWRGKTDLGPTLAKFDAAAEAAYARHKVEYAAEDAGYRDWIAQKEQHGIGSPEATAAMDRWSANRDKLIQSTNDWRAETAKRDQAINKAAIYERSIETDRMSGRDDYYGTPAEITARAFEVYVNAKTGRKPIERQSSSVYLTPDTKQATEVVAAFDKIFAEMKFSDATGEMMFRSPVAYAPEFLAREADVEAALVKVARRLPKEVRVQLERNIQIGRYELDGYWDRRNNVLAVALDKGVDAANGTMRHEEIHALRHFGLFTDREWALLTERANKLGIRRDIGLDGLAEYRDMYTAMVAKDMIRGRGWNEAADLPWAEIKRSLKLKDGDEIAGLQRLGLWDEGRLQSLLDEEAVAELASRRRAGESFGARLDKVIDRIAEFLEATHNALRGLGFDTADAVFRRIETGEVGARADAPDVRARLDIDRADLDVEGARLVESCKMS